ncbi:uncharacterized protein LOC113471346 [Diaphorina citri]|uniref:Uncharacterized protein LOC113471346 n=1 Tax=Diaphorina citri TaxID=121845 RepID=A0A3Q0JCT2_DIACI|nr:uncharacterized protein LOC113471346 [Diaphorina citri]
MTLRNLDVCAPPGTLEFSDCIELRKLSSMNFFKLALNINSIPDRMTRSPKFNYFSWLTLSSAPFSLSLSCLFSPLISTPGCVDRSEFEELFSTYRLPLDPIADPDIQVLTEWEQRFDSDDSLDQQRASADFTTTLIHTYPCQYFLQHSDFIKIVMKKLDDVSSINTVKHVLDCLESCVLNIDEQIRSEKYMIPYQVSTD